MCPNPCKMLLDCKGLWNIEPLLIGHTKILCRWRINLTIVILFPAIILLLESYYLHMTNILSYNPEDEILNEIYEVVTVPNGTKYGHGWFEFSSENETSEKFVNTVFVSWGFQDDKLAWEWAIYNTSNSPEAYKN